MDAAIEEGKDNLHGSPNPTLDDAVSAIKDQWNQRLQNAWSDWRTLWNSNIEDPTLQTGIQQKVAVSARFRVLPEDRKAYDRFVGSPDGAYVQMFLSNPQYQDLTDLVRAVLIRWRKGADALRFSYQFKWFVLVLGALKQISLRVPRDVVEAGLQPQTIFELFCQYSVDNREVFSWPYDKTYAMSGDAMDIEDMIRLLTQTNNGRPCDLLRDLDTKLNEIANRVNARIEAVEVKIREPGIRDRPLAEKKDLLRKYMASRPISNGTLFYLCILRNLPFPLSFLLLRHMQTYSMGTMVVMVKGSRTGNTIVGHACFTFGNDYVQRMHGGHFSMWGQSIIFHPENIAQLPNVYCNDHISGGGVKFWPYTEESRNVYNGRAGDAPSNLYDMHCVTVPAHWQPESTFIDITGNYDPRLCNDEQARISHRLQYPSAALYRNYWEWKHINPDVRNDPSSMPHPRYNTICCRGTQLMYSYTGNGQFKKKVGVRGLGHWGSNVYEGCRADRTGKGRHCLREIQDDFLQPLPFLWP